MASKNVAVFGIYSTRASGCGTRTVHRRWPHRVCSGRAGVGGAVGGLTGAPIGMGIPEYEAKRYKGRVKDGGILLSVRSDSSDETKRAKKILERTGAGDISSTGEATATRSLLRVA